MKWSYSADSMMRRCPRMLAYAHIVASHNARDAIRHEAFILKQVHQLPAWQGQVVHIILKTTFLEHLRTGAPLDTAHLAEEAIALAKRQFAFSASQAYRQAGQTKAAAGVDYCALAIHEFRQPFIPETLDAIYSTITNCFANLTLQHGLLDLLYSAHHHLAEMPLTFSLADHTITATPDLICFDNAGRAIVVDWKIAGSDSSDYARQLHIYALALARSGRWPGLQPEDVLLYEANLLKNVVRQHAVDRAIIDATEDFIYRSSTKLNGLVGDGTYQSLDLDELDVAERPGTCAYCNFASLCRQHLAQTYRPEVAEVVQGQLWA